MGNNIAVGIYAFYSAAKAEQNPKHVWEFRDQTTGEVRPVNYVGAMINGKPGAVNGGLNTVFVPDADSYGLVGRVGPGHFMQCDESIPYRKNEAKVVSYPVATKPDFGTIVRLAERRAEL